MSTLTNALPLLKIYHVAKSFDGAPLLHEVSLDIARGEIVCLLGPSGSGKTTLLRIIAGLEPADRGEIFFGDQNMRAVPVHQRGLGMMFQDLALFPHKNVFDNVAFGLRMRAMRSPREEIRARTQETLELVGLAGFEQRNVNQLSGGEQQRVALARALAPRPKLLMFDEPLGALDRILREQLIADLRAILKRIEMTALYVTHDQDEAFAIADRIAIIHGGRIAQIGAPEEIYRSPADAFVAQFLGMTNLFPARQSSHGRIETELGVFEINAPTRTDKMMVLVRSSEVRVNQNDVGIPARVQEYTFHAGKYRLRVITDGGAPLTIETDQPVAIGARVGLEIEKIEIIPA